MIRGVIIVNNHGKPRLVKFYQTVVSGELVFYAEKSIRCCGTTARLLREPVLLHATVFPLSWSPVLAGRKTNMLETDRCLENGLPRFVLSCSTSRLESMK